MTNLTRDLRRRGPLLWALEPRIMFDGAVAATTATAAAVADATHDASHPAPTPAVIAPVAAPAARQVVFIENDVANYQKLIAQLPAGDEVVVLDSQRDGLAQIAQWAGTHQGYGAMHIISHGEANDLMLGAVQLSNANLASRQADLTTIGQALQPGGDILLYGCDIAAGSDGAAFIQSLAQDTHADVAASTDATGAAALGGNWTLERSTGHIDVASLDLSYDGLLSRPITGTTTFDVADGNVYNPSGSTDSAQNVEGWDFLMQLGQTNNGNQSIIIERPSTVETVDAYSDGTIPITYFSVKPNDGSLFTLNAISVVLNGYDAGTTGGYVQLVGYLNGSAVSGAVLSQNVGDVLQGGGTAVTFNVSGNSAFQGIDSFRLVAASGHSLLGMVGIGAINAINFHFPGPTLTTSGGSSAYSGGSGAAVRVDSGIALSDTASGMQSTATVSITGNFHSGEDWLAFSNNGSTMGNIAGSYNSGTGILTLTSSSASATTAQWQAALEAITYQDTSLTPNTSTRTISFAITDAASNTSSTVTKSVTVAADVAPVIANLNGDTPTYTAGGGAVHLDSGTAATVTDSDSPNFNSGNLTVHISANGQASEDVLGFATSGGSTVSLSNGTNVGSTVTVGSTAIGVIASNGNGVNGHDLIVSLNGSATPTLVTTLVDALTYNDSAGSPNLATRTVQVTVNDGHGQTSSIASIALSMVDLPTLTTSGGSSAFSAGNGSAVTVDSGITLADVGRTSQSSATVSISSNFHSGEDVLAFTNNGSTMGNIAGSYNSGTGILTLTSSSASATNAQWQAALAAVTYLDTSLAPNTSTRTIGFTINNGSYSSSTVTKSVTVAADAAPVISNLNGDSTTFTAGVGAVHLDSGSAATVTDSDSPNFNSGNVTAHISANGQTSEDVLGIDTSGTVSLSNGTSVGSTVSVGGTAIGVIASNGDGVNGHDLVVTLNGNATSARVTTLVDALTYNDSAGSPNTATRTVQVTVNDGHGQTSSAASVGVTVVKGPALTLSSGSAAFVAADNATSTPIVLDGGLTVVDAGSATLASATVSISGNFHSGEDVLAFSNNGSTMGNIVGSYNSGTGVLSLISSSASATLLQWQAALRAITYTDTAVTPNTATRTISVAATDGLGNTGGVMTRTVTVADTDQTPIISASGGSAAFTAGDNAASTPVVIDNGITVSDLDNTTLASAAVSITGNFHSGEDVLAFSNNGSTMGNIVGSYNSGTGVLTLTSSGATATVAQWQAALRSITYS
ncbi:MAG: DUF4347 domain-containing protein, partial [Paludibacterium sp.]|uniref:DUF4347 domain-containing protein n=1 Tax=Paludibacterium sp. TaxID=1917523 RepID=UPI0025F6F586